jgi:hypothetical protein
MVVFNMANWSILKLFGIVCGHCAYFMVIWYIFPRFGMLYQEKAGNPVNTSSAEDLGRKIKSTIGMQ